MTLERIADRVVDTDVLIIGGGIGGCPAAAKAAEHGLKVTLVEKAKTDRSGSAGAGIDHYGGAFPRGMTPKEFAEITAKFGPSAYYGGVPWSDPTRLYRLYANGMWAIEELEKLGVPMRWDDGEFRFLRNFNWGGPFIRVHWMNVKPEMARAVRKRGVNVLERTMAVDLLTNKDVVVGATAVDTRTGDFIVIRAKATVLGTGAFARAFESDTPNSWKYKFRAHFCPTAMAGDGWAMAYRAGAELANLEMTGSGYLPRECLFISPGNLRNEGFPADTLAWDGKKIPGISGGKTYAELEQKGRSPIYRSLTSLPDDFHKRIEVAYADEKLVALKFSQDRGYNPRTHWYEVMPNIPNWLHTPPGINADGDFKATVKGLYAIGDCVAGCHDVANAATAGFLVGDSVHTFVSKAGEPAVDEAQVESQKETALAPLSVKDGTEPMELECAIRSITSLYSSTFRSEGKLREGLRRLDSLRKAFLPRLMAKNPHYLMRCQECRNIMDLAELHIQACLERKETRETFISDFIRLDYPEKDPSLDGLLVYQRLEKGKPVIEMRKVTPTTLPAHHKEGR